MFDDYDAYDPYDDYADAYADEYDEDEYDEDECENDLGGWDGREDAAMESSLFGDC